MGHRTMWLSVLVVCALLAGPGRVPAARAGDLREQFGTKSLEAADHLDAAIKLAQAQKSPEADKEIDQALKLDPDCTMAYFWKAIIVGNLGDIDKSIDWYTKCIDLHPSGADNIVVEAECNIGLIFGKLQRYKESGYWLSRAIVEDEDNRFHLQAKAYRNLAVTLHQRKEDFSAGFAALLAYRIDPAAVSEKMVIDLLHDAEGQEVARLLTIEDAGTRGGAAAEQPAAPAPRSVKAQLSSVALGGDGVAERVTRLLPDPKGRYVIAIARGHDRYYLISPGKAAGEVAVKAVAAPAPVGAACLIEGKLYLAGGAAHAPGRIDEVEIATGKSLREFEPGAVVDSLAVLPSRGAAFVSNNSDVILRVDLGTGKVTNTDEPGQSLTADPTEQFLYTRMKDPPTASVRTAIINGRRVTIRERGVGSTQTVLMKYFVGLHKLIPAAMRVNAASNGYDVVTSPDGRFVAVPGGGGWRPTSPAPGAATGYVIPVFRADDLGQVVGSFSIDAYPLGAAFNPVTNQFAGVRQADVKVFDLGKPAEPAATLKGPFGGACAWSGDGRYLLVANQTTGLSAYANTLSPEESARASTWSSTLTPAPRYGRVTTRPSQIVTAAAARSIDALARFQPDADEARVRKALADAMDHGSTDRPVLWRQYGPYNQNQTSKELQAVLNGHLEPGLRIYRFKQALEKDPASVPARFFLAQALRESGQVDEARDGFLRVVHDDCGRTELSMVSLNDLAAISAAAGKDLAAIDCLAWSLMIDRAHGRTLQQLGPLLEKLKWGNESRRLAALTTAAGGSAAVANGALPVLPAPPAAPRALSADQIYTASAPSVVLIRAGQSAGTGVCIGRAGIIVTSRHVITGADTISVYPFVVENNRARRLARLRAHAVVVDAADDLAVLVVDNPPASLVPLPVAIASPGAGKAVFAIGNPGLGPQTLDLSLSQGIVSTASRMIDGHPYLQHTASVNPGNSGGPLISDTGQVVGIVCLKAQLEGVSFATPIEKVRALFPAGPPARP